LKATFGGPPAKTRDEVIARAVRISAQVGSPAFPSDPSAVAATAALAYDRAHDEVAAARQGIASIASGDRTTLLRALDVPALVVHGLADTLCNPSGGRATAAAIPAAELMEIEGMGHNFPSGLWEQIADRIAALVLSVSPSWPAEALPPRSRS
jgi:pimeloyl-ACP methyl ester carboxylesterase